MPTNPILRSKTKHFELDLYFVRDKDAHKQVFEHHIPSKEQVVDKLTKPLFATAFHKFTTKLKVVGTIPRVWGDEGNGVSYSR